jgi:hypothetical protein
MSRAHSVKQRKDGAFSRILCCCKSKARIDNFVFTCAILHNMLLDNEEWNDEDDNYYHICADAGGNVMDQRVVNLRYGLVDSRYLGEEIRL